MKIRGQTWIETDHHFVIGLREPYWGAYSRYGESGGFQPGVPGIGLSCEAVTAAKIVGKKIRVNILRYGSYEITAEKAQKFDLNEFISRDRKPIIVVPQTAFDKIDTRPKVKAREDRERQREIYNRQREIQLNIL